METSETPQIDRIIRAETGKHLRQHEPIRVALHYLKENPEVLKTRIDELKDGVETLSSMLQSPNAIDTDKYKNVHELKETNSRHRNWVDYSSFGAPFKEGFSIEDFWRNDLRSVFEQVDNRMKTEAWQFPAFLNRRPEKLVSALLIMSYPMLIRKYARHDRYLDDAFVYGLEEVLFNNYPNASLTQDVIGFMRADKEKFSPYVANQLNEPSPEGDVSLYMWNGLEEFAEPDEKSEKSRLLRDSKKIGITPLQLAKLEFLIFEIGDRGPVGNTHWHEMVQSIIRDVRNDDKVEKAIEYITGGVRFDENKSLSEDIEKLPEKIRELQRTAVDIAGEFLREYFDILVKPDDIRKRVEEEFREDNDQSKEL